MIKLLNAQDQVIREFATQKEAIQYCVKEKIMNEGWVKFSLKTGARAYQETNPKKDYRGYGCKLIEV
jgi:hypothetical protein